MQFKRGRKYRLNLTEKKEKQKNVYEKIVSAWASDPNNFIKCDIDGGADPISESKDWIFKD